MDFNAWLAVTGGGFLLTAALGARIAASPFTPVMVFVMVGAALGPWGGGWISLDAEVHAPVLLRISEIIVLVSLFAAGLKLDLPLSDVRWKAAGFLAFISMPLTVGLIAGTMVLLFGWSWGAAILLGGILAPTDPVLATEVQVAGPRDRDRLRFTLTGEAGMNDATAFPFVYLGLGLLGLRDLGEWGWRWLAFDVAAGLAGGAAIGTATGYVTARWIRRPGKAEHAYDECFLLGVVALSYAGAMLVHTAGFISVFAAGVAMRATEKKHVARQKNSAATQEKKRVRAVLAFNEELERILTVGVAALIGVLLASVRWTWEAAGLAAGLFFVLRPLAVAPLTLWLRGFADGRSLMRMGWFGVRGVGSLFYLMYAVEAGLSGQTARMMIDITLITVALSIFMHGITASWKFRPLTPVNSARPDGDGD